MRRFASALGSLGFPGVLLLLVGCQSATSWMSPTLASLPSTKAEKDELPPDQAVQACLAVAHNLEKNGDDIGALHQYERIERLDPTNLDVTRRLAVLYDRASEWAKADAQYSKLAQARPR